MKVNKKLIRKAQEMQRAAMIREQENRAYKKFEFMFLLGTAIVLHDKLGFGSKRRKDFVCHIADKINEISAYLAGNKAVESKSGEESYDVDYNREYLRRLAEEYGVSYDEEVFNDVY